MIYIWPLGSVYLFSPLINRALQGSNVNNNNCVYTTATKVVAALCTKQVFFICEKNYTNFDLKLSEDKWSNEQSGVSTFYLQDAGKYSVFLTLFNLQD